MTRTEKFLKNTFATAILQIVTTISGFIIPKVMLVVFGSEINGMVTSITQMISYLTLLEAGLSGATIYALYKPLAYQDHYAINRILVAAKNFYYKTGYLFLIAIIICGIIYPYFISSNILEYWEIVTLFLILGTNGILEFFTLAKYRALLTADQKTYVISLATIVQIILNIIIIVSLSFAGYSIVIVRLVAILSIFIRTGILWIYCKKKYCYLNFSVTPYYEAMDKRWDALYLQILGVIHQGAPILIATFLLSLKEVSVLAVYNLVILGVNALLGIFMSGLASGFGDLIARKEDVAFKNAFCEFEFIYYILITIIYSTLFFVYLPFIEVFTLGSDINYTYPVFTVLMIINGLFYNLKNPFGMLVISAGKYKETKVQTTIQGVLEIVCGIILAYFYGLNGIIIGCIISNLYRDIDFLFFAPRQLTHMSNTITIRLWLLHLIIFVGAGVLSTYIMIKVTDYFDWFIYAASVFLVATMIIVVIDVILFRYLAKQIFLRFKLILHR